MANPASSAVEMAINQVMDKLGHIIIHKTISHTRTILLKASFQTLIPRSVQETAGKMTSSEEEEAKDPEKKSKIFWVVRLYEKHEVQGLSAQAAIIPLDDFAPEDLEEIVSASRIRDSNSTTCIPRTMLAYSWNTKPTGLEVKVLKDCLQICVHEDESGIHGFDPIPYSEDEGEGHQLAWEFLDVSLELVARLVKAQEERQQQEQEQEAIRAEKIQPVVPKSLSLTTGKFSDLDDRLCQAEHKLEVAHRRLRIKLKRDAKAMIDLKRVLHESRTTTSVSIALADTIEPIRGGDVVTTVQSTAPYEDSVEAMTAVQAVPLEV